MSTFMAYHQPGTSFNIYDPVANPAAAIRYIKARYGTVWNVPGVASVEHGGGYVGYDQGGLLPPGVHTVANLTGRDEWILSPETVDMLGGAAAVRALNLSARLHGAAPAGAVAAGAGRGGGVSAATVNVYPQPRQSEAEIGYIAARRLGEMLS